MNKVIISGKIQEVYDMSHNTILVRVLEENDKDTFYAFWDNNRFQNINEELLRKKVVIEGRLEYIKVLTDKSDKIRRLLAVFVEYMEFYEVE